MMRLHIAVATGLSIMTLSTMVTGFAACAQALQPFTPFVVDSYKCQARSDRGATCDRTVCTTAPDNYAFWKESLAVRPISNAGRGNSWCRHSMHDMRDVPVGLPGGATTTIQLPGKICVNAH